MLVSATMPMMAVVEEVGPDAHRFVGSVLMWPLSAPNATNRRGFLFSSAGPVQPWEIRVDSATAEAL
jgi:hypothetical protein